MNSEEGGEYADLRGVDLRGADLSCTDLRWADLRGADLRNVDLQWTDLRGVDFRGADLRGAGLIVIQLPIWTVYVLKETVLIGCQHLTHADWLSMSETEIDRLSDLALEFYRQYKDLIIAAMDCLKDTK